MNDSDRKGGSPPRLRDLVIVVAVPVIGILVAGGLAGVIDKRSTNLVSYATIITVAGACLGGLTLAVLWKYLPDLLPQAILAAMAVRMLTTLVGIVVFVLILPNLGLKFVIYTIGFYFVGLICETVIAVRKLTTQGPR